MKADSDTGHIEIYPRPPATQVPDDVFTMAFSSGTSGEPKCIMMSAIGTVDAMEAYNAELHFNHDDAILVVLPLTAFPQRLMVYIAAWFGFDMDLADIMQMQRALKEMRPTILVGPPAFYEVLENRVSALPSEKKAQLELMMNVLALIPLVPLRQRLRRQFFGEFHKGYGGRIRLMLTASAPIRISTTRLFERLGFPLYEFYGLTEVSIVSWNFPRCSRLGTVGKPLRPDTVWLQTDGEIWARVAPPRSHGYFGLSPEEERSVYKEDGWVATGDVGAFDEDGFLKIVGRKKSIIITRGGYKLQPEPLERALTKHAAIEHAVVVGGLDAAVTTAVVSVPGGKLDTHEAELLLSEVNVGVPSAAQVVRLVQTETPFSVESGLLTRTMKPDRGAVAKRFNGELLLQGTSSAR